MIKQNCNANHSARAAERAGGVGHGPSLLTGQELEQVAAAGGKAGGVVGSRN